MGLFPPSRLRAVLLILVVSAICHVNSLPGDFVFDDRVMVVTSPQVNGEDGVLQAFAHPYGRRPEDSQGYRPLTVISLAVDYRVGGGDPAPFHVTNLLLHAMAVWGLLFLLLALDVPRSASLLGALLFAVHPLHTEAVAAIVGRSELLVGALGLCMLTLHVGARGPRSSILSSLCLLGALLSKENALLLPLLAALLDLGRGSLRAHIPAHVLHGAAVAVFFLLRVLVLGSVQGAASGVIPFLDNPVAGAAFSVRVGTALVVLLHYVGLTLFPLQLSVDYSFAAIPSHEILSPPAILALVVHGGLIVLGIALLLRKRISGAGILLFYGAFLLTSNLLLPIGTLMGERLAYLPSVGASLVLADVASSLRGRMRVRATAPLVGLLALLTFLSGLRNPDWWDELRLFGSASRVSTTSFKARYNHGLALMKAGRSREAREELTAAITIFPEAAGEARLHRARLLLEDAEMEARERLRLALEDSLRAGEILGDERGHLSAGRILLRQGNAVLAAEVLTRAVQIARQGKDPASPNALACRLELARALWRSGRNAEAQALLDELLSLAPDHEEARAVRQRWRESMPH